MAIPPPVPPPVRGRGATLNTRSARFNDRAHDDDGDWLDARNNIDGGPPPLRTIVTIEKPKTIVTYQRSPDIPFDRSINAYRGCEHVMPGRAGCRTASDGNAESILAQL